MNIQIDHGSINGYQYDSYIDNTGPLSASEYTYIRPIQNNSEWKIIRWFHFEEQSEEYRKEFITNVCTDEQYRMKSINNQADWAIIDEIFDPIESTVSDMFYSTMSTDRSEVLHILNVAYNYIKTQVHKCNRTTIPRSEIVANTSAKFVSTKI